MDSNEKEAHAVNKESLSILQKFLPTASDVYLRMIKDAVVNRR